MNTRNTLAILDPGALSLAPHSATDEPVIPHRLLRVIVTAITLLTLFQPPSVRADTATSVQAALNTSTGAVTGFSLRQIGGPILAAANTSFQYEPASSIKVLHHLHAMLQVQAGAAKLTDVFPVSVVYQGSCPQWPAAAALETLSTAMSTMMWQSDNAATDAIKRRFGQNAINITAQFLGMKKTLLQARPGCAADLIAAPNRLTLDDAATLYETAFTSNLLTLANQQKMNQLMPNLLTEINNLIPVEAAHLSMQVPADFPPNVRVANKAGGDTLCPGNLCLAYRAITGYVELPFKHTLRDGPVIWKRRYTYGVFIRQASSEANANAAFTAAITELWRDEVHKALASFQPKPGPSAADLTISSAYVDDSLMLQFSVKNIGKSNSGVFDVRVNANDGTSVFHVASLAPGASKALIKKVPGWCSAKGMGKTMTASVTADTGFTVLEANEANNGITTHYNSCVVI